MICPRKSASPILTIAFSAALMSALLMSGIWASSAMAQQGGFLDQAGQPIDTSLPIEVAADAFEVYEPHGYRLRPNMEFSRSYPPRGPDSRALTVRSNGDGFRSRREFDEQD